MRICVSVIVEWACQQMTALQEGFDAPCFDLDVPYSAQLLEHIYDEEDACSFTTYIYV